MSESSNPKEASLCKIPKNPYLYTLNADDPPREFWRVVGQLSTNVSDAVPLASLAADANVSISGLWPSQFKWV